MLYFNITLQKNRIRFQAFCSAWRGGTQTAPQNIHSNCALKSSVMFFPSFKMGQHVHFFLNIVLSGSYFFFFLPPMLCFPFHSHRSYMMKPRWLLQSLGGAHCMQTCSARQCILHVINVWFKDFICMFASSAIIYKHLIWGIESCKG